MTPLWQAWTRLETEHFETRLHANRLAAADPDLPWSHRMCAMSAINDVRALS